MQLHTFPWNLPGNSAVLHDIDLTSAKFTMDLISLLVALLSRDQIMTITHFIMLNLFYDISSCPYDMSILNYVLTYAIIFFFFNYLSGECIPNYHENAWIKSYSFHLHGPCCEVSPFNENIFQLLKISMEDVLVITWNIRIILLRHKLWW